MCIGTVCKRYLRGGGEKLQKRREMQRREMQKSRKGKKRGVNKVMEPGPAGALVLPCCGGREGLPPAKNVLEVLEAGST